MLVTHPRTADDLPFVYPRSKIEAELCEIWSEVLGRPVQDVSATFTDLGANSILAALAAARIHHRLGVRIGLTTIFRCQTVQALASSIEGTRAMATDVEDIALVPLPSRDRPPMSFFQEWRFRADENRSDALYTITLSYELHGGLRPEVLRDAISELARRHESLRTNYDINAFGPVQVIHPPTAVELPVLDVRGSPEGRRRAEALQILRKTAAQLLDRRNEALFQPLLTRFADDGYLLMIRVDHIAVDGTSCQILEKELSMLYARFLAGGDAPDPPALQQADWASWQRQLMQTPRMARAVGYWRRKLDGTRPLLELRLPSGFRPASAPPFRGRSVHRQLGLGLSGELRRRARDADVTLFMYMLAALKVFISRLTGQDTATILCPFVNRTRPEVENIVGAISHSLIYRTDLSGDPSFSEIVARVREVCLGAWEHQELPVSEVARHVRPVSYLTLYDEFHVFCDLIRAQPSFQIAGLDIVPTDIETGAAHPSLAVLIEDVTEKLGLIMRADADRFDASAIQWCMREFSRLLAAAAGDPEKPISSLPPSPESVRRRFDGP
jgi:hypothetical protein